MFKKIIIKTGALVSTLTLLLSMGSVVSVSAAPAKPATPKQVSAVQTTETSAKISWKKVDGVNWYQIYRATGSGEYKILKTVEGTSYVNTGLKDATTYRYKVRAIKGNTKGTFSATQYVRTIDQGDKFQVTAKVSGVQIRLKWNEIKNADRYMIYRRTATGTYKKLGTTAKLTYKDTSLSTLNTKYVYKVVAYNKSGNKIFTGRYGTVSATTAKRANLMDVVSGHAKNTFSWETIPYEGFTLSWYGSKSFALDGNFKTVSFTLVNLHSSSGHSVNVYCDDVKVMSLSTNKDTKPQEITLDVTDIKNLKFTGSDCFWFGDPCVGIGDLIVTG